MVFEDADNEVNIRYQASDNFGILGRSDGEVIFSLGANLESGVANNQIAGWEFSQDKLQGDKMIIRSNGTIESDGFQSNVAFPAKADKTEEEIASEDKRFKDTKIKM